jgi:hypothetical protein
MRKEVQRVLLLNDYLVVGPNTWANWAAIYSDQLIVAAGVLGRIDGFR